MEQITSLEFMKARRESNNFGLDFVTTYKSKCKCYTSRAYQVDTDEYEYVEVRFNRRTGEHKYYGSR